MGINPGATWAVTTVWRTNLGTMLYHGLDCTTASVGLLPLPVLI